MNNYKILIDIITVIRFLNVPEQTDSV